MRPHTPHYTPLARPHAMHARPHMLTGPRTSATYTSLRLSTRRFWNSEHVMAIVHTHPHSSIPHSHTPFPALAVRGANTETHPQLVTFATQHATPVHSHLSAIAFTFIQL